MAKTIFGPFQPFLEESLVSEIARPKGKDPFSPQVVEGEPHKRRAWGFAVTFKNTGLGEGAPDNASAEIELLPDGRVETRISSAEIGQGLVTVLQMVCRSKLRRELCMCSIIPGLAINSLIALSNVW